ncbi:MAG: hypothetical protein RMM07_11730 [Anaerolineae bacterium]|uniref:hypothetical protein n=1 Tax=Thermoflexus sp. TaxID=1969742 RepID=UPI0025E8DC2D|nr:hypothetical protein [Thermoflexus sp.]MCS7351324.1 glycosyltransferase family 39 protein [Thermoflexus sp.]MDW8180779.1 hypothetical protein [Anaerolineae bacterium]MDW8185909.1 hypothetical protein [Anaerolineae bacterium]
MRKTGWLSISTLWLLAAWMLALALWRPSLAHNDEAHIVWVIRTHDLPGLIAAQIRLDGQPPLYSIVLWAIQQVPLFRTVPMLYFVGLFLAFPLYPLMLRLAWALGDRRAARVLTVLLAFNPFALGMLLFLRAYSLTLMLSALTLWLAVRADRRPTPGRALAWGLSGLLLFFTFYYGAFLVAATVLWLLRRPYERARWLAAALGAGIPGFAGVLWSAIALLPAIAIVIRHQGNPGIRPGPPEMLLNLWLTLWSGWAADARLALAAGGALGALFLGALGWAARGRIPVPASVLLGAIPLAGFLIGGWRYNFFAARYAVVALPPLWLGIAFLLARAPRGLRAAFLGLAGLIGLIGLSRAMAGYVQLPENNPWYAEIGVYLREHAAPGDVVIVQAPWHYQALLMHGPDLPWRLFDLNEEAEWRAALRDRPVVWLLGVPAYRGNWAPVEEALAGWIRDELRVWPLPADAVLVRYVPPPETPVWRPIRARFADGLVVEAAALDREGPPGILRVGLQIRASERISQAYTLFIHLLDPAGRWISGSDAEPPVPTTALEPGVPITLWRALEVPSGIPADRYRVAVGWYPTGSGGWPRLPTVDGADAAALGELALQPRPPLIGRLWRHPCGDIVLLSLNGIRLTAYQQKGPDIFPIPGQPDRLRVELVWETTGAEAEIRPPEVLVEARGGLRSLKPITGLEGGRRLGRAKLFGAWEGRFPPEEETKRVVVICGEDRVSADLPTRSRQRWAWNYTWIFWNRMP